MSKFKFLRKRSEYYRHFTVLDIGTDLIKVLVVRRDGPDGEVLGVGREPQAPAAMSGGAIADLESRLRFVKPPAEIRTPSRRRWSSPCEEASTARCVTHSPAS